MILTRGGRSEKPTCPYEIREVIELYAREGGRTASVHFAPGIGWFARLSLKPNDKRMKLWREGRAPEPPTEDIYFRKPKDGTQGEYVQLNILQMGPSGVKEFLERGNTWSGRGEHSSLVEVQEKEFERQKRERKKAKRDQKEQFLDELKGRKRVGENRPYLTVGIDLK